MRKLIAVFVSALLLATACQAQDKAPSAHMLCVARVMEALRDMQVLGVLVALQLTEAQTKSLAAVYQQFPVPAADPALVQEAAAKIEQIRGRLVSGTLTDMAPLQSPEMQKLLAAVFGDFGHRPDQAEQPVTELTAAEKLVWAILTPAQQGRLFGGGDMRLAGARAMDVLGRQRTADGPTWTAFRDHLAEAIAAGAGAAGTPARDNSRRMFVDFLDRLRKMSAADFAAKQQELGSEIAALLPPGFDLVNLAAEFDPGGVHVALGMSLLHPRAPALLEEMQAGRERRER